MPPLVTVVIPTRNRAHLVGEAIESVLASPAESLRVEILVVDDGSTDDTEEKVRRLPVRYLRGPGRGVSVARNTGLEHATGAYVTFLDDDDLWAPGHLVKQVAQLEARPEFGAACCQVVLTDADRRPISVPYPDPPFESGWLFEQFLNYIPQVGTLLVRREVVKAVGGFDPALQGGEDWDWALRVAQACRIFFLPEVGLFWRMHATARIDGAGNSRPEDVTWRRYTDVLSVARRHLRSEGVAGWLRAERTRLRHKGHYVPLFLDFAAQALSARDLSRAARCCWLAWRASPPHLAASLARSAGRGLLRERG